MGEIKDLIQGKSREITESYRWVEYEDIPTRTVPPVLEIASSKNEISDKLTLYYFKDSPEEFFGKFAFKGSDEITETPALKRQTTKKEENIKRQLRMDYCGGISSVLIDRVNGFDKYSDIQLINADRFQKVSDPKKWCVFTIYGGGGHTDHAIGIMVRKRDFMAMKDSKERVSKHRIGG